MKTARPIQPKGREYVLDAQGYGLGRFATKVAIHLRGKMEPQFAYHKMPNVHVTVKNIDKLDISEKKLSNNMIIRFTGFHGD